MTRNNSQIEDLIMNFLKNSITPEQMQQLNEWREECAENEELFQQLINERVVSGELQKIYDFDEEKGWQKLQISTNVDSGQAGYPGVKKLWFKRLMAAAIFIGILVGGYWLFQQLSKEPHPSVNLPSANNSEFIDKLPGESGALLILDNGQQLELDSTANGNLTVQGDVKLSKESGHLTYTRDGQKSAGDIYNTIVIPKARQYSLTLSDGSKVWLNSASSIRFPVAFAETERRVEITGEVYFEVNPQLHKSGVKKPFIVMVNPASADRKVEIEVVGTHFNVNAFDDEKFIRTTLLEGAVRLTKAGAKPVNVVIGQQARISDEPGADFSIENDVDLDKVIAWKKGLFEFDDTELPVIMRQLSRWYDVEIEYEKKPSAEKFGGAISKQVPLSQVLRMLKLNGVSLVLDGNKLKVKP